MELNSKTQEFLISQKNIEFSEPLSGFLIIILRDLTLKSAFQSQSFFSKTTQNLSYMGLLTDINCLLTHFVGLHSKFFVSCSS